MIAALITRVNRPKVTKFTGMEKSNSTGLRKKFRNAKITATTRAEANPTRMTLFGKRYAVRKIATALMKSCKKNFIQNVCYK